MTPLEKTEQLIERGQAKLNDVREKILVIFLLPIVF